MNQKLLEAIDILVLRANELNEVSQSGLSAPMEAGRASWERRGILFALKTLCEQTSVIAFDELFDK